MPDRNEKIDALTAGTEAVFSATAMAIELQQPGVGVALAAVVPVLTHVAARAWDRVFSRAEAESGLTHEEIIRRLIAVENGVRLLSRTVDAVRVAPYEAKLRLLGRALANGAKDQALIDPELLLVNAISALEPFHVRLLSAMSQLRARKVQDGEEDPALGIGEVEDVDPGLDPDVTELLVGALAGQGALSPHPATGGLVYRITPLGDLLLERCAS